jgi:hypothetical protein
MQWEELSIKTLKFSNLNVLRPTCSSESTQKYLMLDSGIKDVHMEGLGKLFDKFSVNMKDK